MITALENIPLFSYIFLGGKCRHCRTHIPIRYPLIEATTGALFAFASLKFGLTLEAGLFAALFWTLVVLTVIDLEHKLLPNSIVYPAFVVGWVGLSIAALVDGTPGRLLDAAMGAGIYGGFFLLVGFIYPAGMGGGDIKLAFVLGTFLGYVDAPGVVFVGMFLGFMAGGVPGIIALLWRGAGRKTALPFGPAMALGAVVAVFAGKQLVDAYLDLFI